MEKNEMVVVGLPTYRAGQSYQWRILKNMRH
jgi:hypothetical protein